MKEYSESPYVLASEKISLKCRSYLWNSKTDFILRDYMCMRNWFLYSRFSRWRAGTAWALMPILLFQAGNGARWAREQVWGWDGHGERYGSLGAGCLPSLPLVQMQRPRAQEIHTVRTHQRWGVVVLLKETEVFAGPGTWGRCAALC